MAPAVLKSAGCQRERSALQPNRQSRLFHKVVRSKYTSRNEHCVNRDAREAARQNGLHRPIVRASRQYVIDQKNTLRRRVRDRFVDLVYGEEIVDRRPLAGLSFVRGDRRLRLHDELTNVERSWSIE